MGNSNRSSSNLSEDNNGNNNCPLLPSSQANDGGGGTAAAAKSRRTKFWQNNNAKKRLSSPRGQGTGGNSRSGSGSNKNNGGGGKLHWLLGANDGDAGGGGAGRRSIFAYRHSVACLPLEQQQQQQRQPRVATEMAGEEAGEDGKRRGMAQEGQEEEENNKYGGNNNKTAGRKSLRMRKCKSEKSTTNTAVFSSAVPSATLNFGAASDELATFMLMAHGNGAHHHCNVHQGDNDSLDEYALCGASSTTTTTTAGTAAAALFCTNNGNGKGGWQEGGIAHCCHHQHNHNRARRRRPSSSGEAEMNNLVGGQGETDAAAAAALVTADYYYGIYQGGTGAGRKGAATTKSKSFRQVRTTTIRGTAGASAAGFGSGGGSLCRHTGLSQIQKRLILSRWDQMRAGVGGGANGTGGDDSDEELQRLCEAAFQTVFQRISGQLACAILKLDGRNDAASGGEQEQQQRQEPQMPGGGGAVHSSSSAAALHYQRAFRLHVQRFCLVLSTLLDNLLLMDDEGTARFVEQLAMEFGAKLAIVENNGSGAGDNATGTPTVQPAGINDTQTPSAVNNIPIDYWHFLTFELVRSGVQNQQQQQQEENNTADAAGQLQQKQDQHPHQQQHRPRRGSLLLASNSCALYSSRRSAEAWMLLCTYVVMKIRFVWTRQLYVEF